MNDPMDMLLDSNALALSYTQHIQVLSLEGTTTKQELALRLAVRDATITALQRKIRHIEQTLRDNAWRRVSVEGRNLFEAEDVLATLRNVGVDLDPDTDREGNRE